MYYNSGYAAAPWQGDYGVPRGRGHYAHSFGNDAVYSQRGAFRGVYHPHLMFHYPPLPHMGPGAPP